MDFVPTSLYRLIAKAEDAFERTTAKAPDDVRPYAAKRALEIAKGNHDAAVEAAQTALRMAPNDSYTAAALSFALTCADRPVEALAQMTKAAQDMTDLPGWFSIARILCHFQLGDLEKALELSRETVLNDRELHAAPALNAALAAEIGLSDEAARMSERTLDLDPQFSARTFVRWQGLKNKTHSEKLLNALEAAGLPP